MTMPNTFFTSDLHLGHRNIIQFEKDARPFDSVEAHDEAIIANWNAVVGPDDVVWVLGDVCFGRRTIPKLAALKGRKHLVMGNHDSNYAEELRPYFSRMVGVWVMGDWVLTHVPVHPNQLDHRYRVNVHGHLHSKRVQTLGYLERPDPRYINVCLEHTGLAPVALEQIRKDLL